MTDTITIPKAEWEKMKGVVEAVPALIEQLDMSTWVEQDTGVGHKVKNLKALLDLKEATKGVENVPKSRL